MIRVRNFTHVAISVPNVEETVEFYEKIVGLETSGRDHGAAFLRCNRNHHCLAIYPGDRALHHLGLEVSGEPALEQAEHELAAQGFRPEPRDYSEPGHGSGLCYRDPDGNRVELYAGMQTLDQPLEPREVRPVGFGHITLMTADLPRCAGFYTDVLGFRVSDTVDNSAIWLRCNQQHHGVAILQTGQAKVNHYAYDLADWSELKKICDHLWKNDVPIIYGPGRHGPGHNIFIYIPDPAGNVLELTLELDQIWDEETYRPLNWTNEPKTVDVWRALPQPPYMLEGEGRDFTDWSTGSPLIGRGWSIPKVNGHEMLDPTATVTPPTSETPELKIEIPTFTLKFDNPLDHVKAMLVSDRRYPTGEGLSVSVDLCVEVNGTEANPFGADPDNPKLGSGAIALIDNTTGVVLNFEVSNRRILALREHFKVKSPTGKDSTLPMIDPLLTDMTIEPGSWHRYEIRYQPGEDGWLEAAPDYAQWLVDGRIVREVNWVATIDQPSAPIVLPARFRVIMAIFTLLDDLPDGRGGVVPGLDSQYRHSLFGQGVTARWRNLKVLTSSQAQHIKT